MKLQLVKETKVVVISLVDGENASFNYANGLITVDILTKPGKIRKLLISFKEMSLRCSEVEKK